MSAEFEQLVAEFEKFQSSLKNVDERLADVAGLRAELADLEATASSPDRAVTVVAGPGGSIKDIRFTEEALRQRPQELSATVMSALRTAVADVARRQAALVDGHLGSELNLSEQVLEAQAEAFGVPVEELRTAGSPSAPPVSQPDDFAEQSFVRDHGRPSPPPVPRSGDNGGSQGDQFLQNLFDDEDRR